jgi:uroporphyrinogen decarboxylase
MTNYERAVAALERQTPDMVPIFELLIDERVIKGACPECSYEDFAEKYDLDIVLTGTPSSNYRIEMLDKNTKTFKTEWGVTRRDTDQTVSFPLEGPIKSEEDLENYTPPNPHDPYRFVRLKRLLDRFKGRKMVGMHMHDAFTYPTYLRGMEELLMDLLIDPDLVKKLVRIGVEHSKELIKGAAELGADLIVFGDDYGGNDGPLMSPMHFEEFFLPGMREVVETAKNEGLYVIKHTDGNISDILEAIVSTGIDGIHPLDPEAGMSIKKVKDAYGDRVCVMGNIDTGKILSESTPEVVEKTVLKTIMDVAPGGGYIIASANSIHPKVKPENYVRMLESARKYGNYSHLGSAA